MNQQEFDSIIKLMDDPNPEVYQAIKKKLENYGPIAIPFLEDAWESSMDQLFQNRIENIIQEIHQVNILAELTTWSQQKEHSLFEGAYLIAKYQYPRINKGELFAKINKIKNDVWLEINPELTALEKVRILNHVFFEVHGFSRSNSFQKSVQGFFINNALEHKNGSPIALAIIYMVIAQDLNMPIQGVALPKNFILCYKDEFKDSNEFENNILFYINPFNKGVVFGRKEIDHFIKQQKLEQKEEYYQSSTNKNAIIELIKNIIAFYLSKEDETKVKEYEILLKNLYF